MYHTIVRLICINGKLMKQVSSRVSYVSYDDAWTVCSYAQLKEYADDGGTKVEWL